MTSQALQRDQLAPDLTELLRRARALAPRLRGRAEECETLRRIPDETIADLIESRVLRLCQPARFGGSELGWDALCEMSIELARGDGSQAWVGNIYAEHAFFVALFSDQAQHDVWDADGDALACASVVPLGNPIERVAGGYRLNGQWRFASGVHHAGWAILGELVKDGEGPGEHYFFLVPSSDYTIVDDWRTVGMVGTGSNSIQLKDVFVPEHRALSNRAILDGSTPGAEVNKASQFRMPFLGFAQLALASVPIGVAAGMTDDFRNGLAKRKPAPGQGGLELHHERLAESAAEVRAASLLLCDTARRNMERLAAGASLGEADIALSLRDAGFAAKLARRTATRLFETVGASGIYLSTPMQRAFRDVHAAASHAALNWERNALRYSLSVLSE